MAKNIVLIGFMGTGKTTIGNRLAEKLNRNFVDMDREIESLTGMTIADIFKMYGEVRFRSEETLMAHKLGRRSDLVISTGGGTVLQNENVAALKENGVLICLDAQPTDIHARVNRKKGSRPLLKKDITINEIEEFLKQREPFYACADIRISTSNKNTSEIAEEIIQNLRIKDWLD